MPLRIAKPRRPAYRKSNPLADGLLAAWLFTEGGDRSQQDVSGSARADAPRELISGARAVMSVGDDVGGFSGSGWTRGGWGWALEHGDESGSTLLGASNLLVPTDAATVVLAYRKKDATHRASAAFSVPVAAALESRFDVTLPWSDGKVYWDFGGTTEGATRLSVSGLNFTSEDVWVLTTGSRGMEIWQSGVLRASNVATPLRTAIATQLILGVPEFGVSDPAEFSALLIYRRQLPVDSILALSADPFEPVRRSPRRASRSIMSSPSAGVTISALRIAAGSRKRTEGGRRDALAPPPGNPQPVVQPPRTVMVYPRGYLQDGAYRRGASRRFQPQHAADFFPNNEAVRGWGVRVSHNPKATKPAPGRITRLSPPRPGIEPFRSGVRICCADRGGLWAAHARGRSTWIRPLGPRPQLGLHRLRIARRRQAVHRTPARAFRIGPPLPNRLAVTGQAAGRYRVSDAALAGYLLYRGVNAAPNLAGGAGAAWEIYTAKPHLTAALAAGNTYRFVERLRNRFGLISQNVAEWELVIGAGGTRDVIRPSAPGQTDAAAYAAGVVRITSRYGYAVDGPVTSTSGQGDAWLIYVTTNGVDPNPAVDVPVEIAMRKSDGIAKLLYDTAAQLEGTVVKAIVRVRRNGLLPVPDVDSNNVNVVSVTATLLGPSAVESSSAHLGEGDEVTQ